MATSFLDSILTSFLIFLIFSPYRGLKQGPSHPKADYKPMCYRASLGIIFKQNLLVTRCCILKGKQKLFLWQIGICNNWHLKGQKIVQTFIIVKICWTCSKFFCTYSYLTLSQYLSVYAIFNRCYPWVFVLNHCLTSTMIV